MGFSAQIQYYDEDVLDSDIPNVTVDTVSGSCFPLPLLICLLKISNPLFDQDIIFEIASIVALAEELAYQTKFLDGSSALNDPIPLIGKSVNELIAGDGRTIADMLDFTQWAKELEPNQNETSPGGDPIDTNLFITKTELLTEMRKELQALFARKPDINEIPTPPNVAAFQEVGFVSSVARSKTARCANNTGAISVTFPDGDDPDDFTILICSLLGFQIDADLDASGLLDLYDKGSITLDLSDTRFALEGSLTIGAELNVKKSDTSFSATLFLDPLVAKIAVVASPTLTIGLGLVEFEGGIDALAQGE